MMFLVALLVIAISAGVGYLFVPALTNIIDLYFEPGLGLKNAAIYASVVTVVILIVFAVASGDGLLGEFQFMIGGFFAFFLFFWLMLAWVF